jgi:hypothetical protein
MTAPPLPEIMRRPSTALVFVALSALMSSAPIAAQESPLLLPQLSPGVRVRIDAPTVLVGRLATTVVSRSRDSVKVKGRERNAAARDDERLAYLTLPVDQITFLEVSEGRSQLKGAIVGGLAGAAVGVALVNMDALVGADDNAKEDCQFDCEGFPASRAAAVGATIGAFAGLFFGHERWKRVDFAPRTSLERGLTGGTVALHLRF